MEHSQRCPDCGAVMEYRLGLSECGSCGRIDDRLPPPPDAEVEAGDGKPAHERAREYRERVDRDPAEEPASWLPPPPPEAGLSRFLVGQPEQPETTYVSLYPSLPAEKRVIIWLIGLPQVLGIVFVIVTIGSLHAMTGGISLPPDPEIQSMQSQMNMIVAGMIAGTLIYVGVVYAALFLDSIPLKWGCGVCTVLLALMAIISFLFPSPSDFEGYGSGYDVGGAMLGRLILVALWIWLVSIFYRDLRERGSL